MFVPFISFSEEYKTGVVSATMNVTMGRKKRWTQKQMTTHVCCLLALCMVGRSVPLLATHPLILGNIDLGKGVSRPNQGNWAKGVTDHRVTGDF